MKLFDAFRSALQSIIVNKLRSTLTMLGVVIGVAAVIAMVAVGNGASAQAQSSLLALGSNLVTVTPGAQSDQGLRGAGAQATTLTLDDMRAVQDQLGATITAVEAEQATGRWQVVAGTNNWNTQVTGVTEQYPLVRDWSTQSGDFFTDSDLRLNAQVAVLGATTADNLFAGADAVGQTIQLRQVFANRARIINFKVVGVLEPKGTTFGFSRDDQILVPTTTAQRVLTGRTNVVNAIIVKAASSDTMADTTEDVRNVLLQRHKIGDAANADFTVTNQNDTLAAINNVTAIFTILLGAIGGISLLVGGIGIMNIMLVSVNERTREIGIRKAVGARRGDIMRQFLIEAVALTGLGGLLGITLGFLIVQLVQEIARRSQLQLLPIVTSGTVFIAVGVSVGIGVLFGLYPAVRAARLHPIQALRYE
ncbi:MAG: ABC transporter permease [Chloroflexota bacterium]|nr:ABC transporter permease [Chloroflexota bacterium]